MLDERGLSIDIVIVFSRGIVAASCITMSGISCGGDDSGREAIADAFNRFQTMIGPLVSHGDEVMP